MTNLKIKSPFSIFGGKSRVANTIWERFGEVSNYVEPFAGSLAVLLANPKPAKIETVNDINHFISNFFRAIAADPDGVIKYAEYPINEVDLHARHKWLVSDATNEFKLKMNSDPNYYDLKIAGWWVWGMGASIGSSWLNPHGVNSLPALSSGGNAIHGLTYNITDQFIKLQKRLKLVRVACGDWKRIMTPSITFNNKGISSKCMTGIFLDPPYLLKGRDKVYANESNVFKDVCDWAIENGDNKRLRIAVCGYDGDYIFPDTWKKFFWKANGGYGNAGNDRGKANSFKETIWFNNNCLGPTIK